MLWTSLLFGCLTKNDGGDLKAACVGWLDQSEAKNEAARSDDQKGGLATFRPQLEQLSLVTGVLKGRPHPDTTMAAQHKTRPQKN